MTDILIHLDKAISDKLYTLSDKWNVGLKEVIKRIFKDYNENMKGGSK